MKTYIALLNHVYAGREFGQHILVEADNYDEAKTIIIDHQHEAGFTGPDGNGSLWEDGSYYISIVSIKEVNSFEQLKGDMVLLPW